MINFTHIVELKSPILYAKFQDPRSLGLGEEDFKRFSPYMDMTDILNMRPGLFINTFVPPSYRGFL